MSTLPGIVSALTADGLALLMGQPPFATAAQSIGEGYKVWLSGRAKEAHEILLTEMSKGTRLSSDVDPNTFFGLLHRYLNATKQGAARQNLKLMAQVLRGSLEEDCPFKPDELAANAELVASLTRNEIRFLACYWKAYEQCKTAGDESDLTVRTQETAKALLVPEILTSKAEFNATGTAISRTGLLLVNSGWDGAIFFVITTKLIKLVQICNLEEQLSD